MHSGAESESLPTGDAGHPPLTTRRIEVLSLMAQGLTYKETGARLYISERTVKYHMGEIIERLQVANKRQTVAYAKKHETHKTATVTTQKNHFQFYLPFF